MRLLGFLCLFFGISAHSLGQNILETDSLTLELKGVGCGLMPTHANINYNIPRLLTWLDDHTIKDKDWVRNKLAMQYYKLQYTYKVDSAKAQALHHFGILCDSKVSNYYTYGSCMNMAVIASMDQDCDRISSAIDEAQTKDLKRKERQIKEEKRLRQLCKGNC